MSEEQQENHTLTVGSMLVNARQRLNLRPEDIAEKLKLGLRQVNALEQGHYEQLPGDLFVRGFVRSYAKLVGADEALLLQTLSYELKPVDAPAISAAGENIALQPRHIPLWVFVVGFVLFVALVAPILVYYGLNRDLPQLGKAAPATETKAASQPAVSLPASGLASAPIAVPLAVAPKPVVAASMTAAAPLVASSPAVSASAVQAKPGPLQLRFSGESWVEVYDGQHARVFYQLGKAGDVANVGGMPPFEVVIGNAAAVSVAYRGQPVDLAPFTRVNVARLKLQ